LHRLAPGRRLILAGVEIPHDKGLAGHSDADVVLHAVIDALAGAAGLPDIGEQFPDNDPAWRDADSATMLSACIRRVREAGYDVACVDVVVHAERPKLTPWKPRMRARLSEIMGVAAERVSIKAKTSEGQDAVGRGGAIACTAVAGLTRRESRDA
jgi:2-C-methyl-D-erythritol 2,4-cyclodiphosphate synthase